MSKKKIEKAKEERIIELEKRLVKKKLRNSIPENLDNIPYLKDGRRTWQRQILRLMKGA